jgi:hypothetical protein
VSRAVAVIGSDDPTRTDVVALVIVTAPRVWVVVGPAGSPPPPHAATRTKPAIMKRSTDGKRTEVTYGQGCHTNPGDGSRVPTEATVLWPWPAGRARSDVRHVVPMRGFGPARAGMMRCLARDGRIIGHATRLIKASHNLLLRWGLTTLPARAPGARVRSSGD